MGAVSLVQKILKEVGGPGIIERKNWKVLMLQNSAW
jgi:hypothetical protein